MNLSITSTFKAIKDAFENKKVMYDNTLQKGKKPISSHDGLIEVDEKTLKKHGIK